MALLIPLAGRSAGGGVFVDAEGKRHPWSITDTHVLIWDSAPYLPFGGMFCGWSFWQDSDAALERDRQVLAEIRARGVEDLYLNPVRRVPPPRLQQMLDLVEAEGFHYGLQICTPPRTVVPALRIDPNAWRVMVTEASPVTIECEGATQAWAVVAGLTDGRLLWHGQVEGQGRFAVPVTVCPPGGAVVKLIPRTTMPWVAPEDADDTTGYLQQLRFGATFRFLIDPIGNEYVAPRFIVPSHTPWRNACATWLQARYTTLENVAQAWGLDQTPAAWAVASAMVPLLSGPPASPWSTVGYAVDDTTGTVFRVDLSLSRLWDDLCEYREIALRQALNDLCDQLKRVVDVPIIAKRHHESTRLWSNPGPGGLDGLGMESYGGGERLGTFNAAATYADVVQAGRPMWCLVTESNAATWTDRHIGSSNRQAMYRDLNLLLGQGARGVFLFGLSLAGSAGDKGWTIFELANDPRQLEWLATFGRAARARADWLTVLPDTAFAYPPQPADAKAFTDADLPDYGISGSWFGPRSILELGPDRWLAPVYSTQVPGPVLHTSIVDEHPRFAVERRALARATDTGVLGSLDVTPALPKDLQQRFARAPAPPVAIAVSEPVPGIEAVTWTDHLEVPHTLLRAAAEALRLTVSVPGQDAALVQLPESNTPTRVPLPLTLVLPASPTAPADFILSNPGFMSEPVHFACPVGNSAPPLEIHGVPAANIQLTVTPP